MPAFPPPSALTAHRELHHSARIATRPGVLVIAGISYAAEIYIGPVEYETSPDGSGALLVQRMTARVLKTALTTAPARQTVITAQSLRFESGKVEGQLTTEPAWLIHGIRLPKAH